MDEPDRRSQSERRKTPRQRVFKGAQILGHGPDVACVIRNLSPDGAGIEITGNAPPLQGEVTLLIGAEKVVRRGRLRWRDAKKIGVEFD